jgi:uncharacterized protein involved in exopolysaccharide biosynthesis
MKDKDKGKDKGSENYLNIIVVIVQWWKTLLVVGVAAAVVSAGASMLIRPKFRSSVIMMPTASNALSQMILIAHNQNEYLDATQFGDDMKIDQMLQILNSREVKAHLIEKFNLIVHYDIDTTSKYWKTKLYERVKDNCTYSRTNFMGVQISVLDEDPQFAADMANEIADYYDVLKRKVIQQRTEEAFVILQEEMNDLDETVSVLEDSLSKIMSYGVYDYDNQSQRLVQQYAKEVASGNSAAAKRIKSELDILAEWGPAFFSVRERIQYLKEFQMELQQKYQAMRVDANYSMTQKFVVEYAVASDKKAYPKRSMIVILSTFCALSLGLLFVITKDGLKKAYHQIRNS